jgi:hypothetical protein
MAASSFWKAFRCMLVALSLSSNHWLPYVKLGVKSCFSKHGGERRGVSISNYSGKRILTINIRFC